MTQQAKKPNFIRRAVDTYGMAKIITTSLITVVVILLVAAFVVFGPVFHVRNIAVEGNEHTTYDEIHQTSGINDGQKLFLLDARDASAKVAKLPWVEKASVDIDLPSTVNITVVERQPVLFTSHPDGDHLIDGSGVAFLIAPHPDTAVEALGSNDDPATLATAARIVTALAPEVRGQLHAIDINSTDRITLLFSEDRSVFWGSAEELEQKARVTATVLTQPGQKWNISDPYLVSRSPD